MDRGIFEMDDSAQELFEQLGGIDRSNRTLPQPKPAPRRKETLGKLLLNLDEWRIHLIDMAHLISVYLSDAAFLEESTKESKAYDELVKGMKRFADTWSGHGKTLTIHYRGETGVTGRAMEMGYYVRFHNIEVDMGRIPTIIKRVGAPAAYLKHRLFDAFKRFSRLGILTINIKMPTDFDNDIPVIRDSLQVLNLFFQSARESSGETRPFVIFNEWSQPEPNLTLMTALSLVKPEKMKAVIAQIIDKMHDSDSRQYDYQYLSVYDALLNIRNLPFKLVKPPVEINTLASFLSSVHAPKVTKSTGLVVKTVMDGYAKNPSKALRVMDTIYGDEKVYGNDFVNKDYRLIGMRIREADELLRHAGKSPEKESLEREIIKNIGARLADVNDEVLDALFIPEKVAKLRQGRHGMISGTEIFRGIENLRLRKMIEYYKIRSYSRKKIKEMINGFVDLTEEDYAVLAKDFKMTRGQVRELLELLRNCFDENGNFKKKTFEKSVPKFALYEKSVFEFLWHYLKTLDLPKNDRISFLNSFQLLIDKIKLRKKALRMLLSDVFRNPTVIEYSDRNAMILANLLIRKYNKEKLMDIEVTPEEVLLVENGIDYDVTEYAETIIDGFQEIFLIKMMTVQKLIKHVLQKGEGGLDGMSFRFVLSLEREILSFFALVGGMTGQAVMRIAMKEYGDPAAEIYHFKYSSAYMPILLQRLRMVVRGFGRVGEEKDLSILNEVKGSQKEFLLLARKTKNIINQIMEFIDNSMNKIMVADDAHCKGWC